MRTIAAFAVVLAAGVATAQGVSAAPPRPQPMLPSVENPDDVPDDQKLQRSTRALGDMRLKLREVLAKVEEARRTKDVVKLNCANEKLSQIKGLLRISEQADVALQEALASPDASRDKRAQEYLKVMIAHQKVVQLRTEAEQCIGQLAFRTDENLFIEVQEPDNLPGGDPTRPADPGDTVVRPPPASPVR